MAETFSLSQVESQETCFEVEGGDSWSTTTPIEKLPEDLIYDFFTKLPLDVVLCECRWVNKQWHKLSQEPSLKHHPQSQTTLHGFIVENQSRPYGYSIKFLPNPQHGEQAFINHSLSLDYLPVPEGSIHIVASTLQGLLYCFCDARIPMHYICKPTTQQWKQLPNPRTRFFTEASGTVVNRNRTDPLSFKIMRLSQPKKTGWKLGVRGYHLEIFNSGDWKWKRFDDIELSSEEIVPWKQGILVGRSFHWVLNEDYILAIDVDNGNWTRKTLPRIPKNMGHVKLVECEGRLGVFYIDWLYSKVIDFWVMNHHRKMTWQKIFSRKSTCSIIDMFSSELVVVQDKWKVRCYDWRNNTDRNRKSENGCIPISVGYVASSYVRLISSIWIDIVKVHVIASLCCLARKVS